MRKLEIYDMNRVPVCMLQNAFDIQEQQSLNALWYLDFKLPATDAKNEFCNAYWYARFNDGELYRMFPNGYNDASDLPYYSYHCEHVLATLLNKVMPGIVTMGGYYQPTPDVLRAILAKQDIQDWVLGECDFSRRFEYGFEKENLLAALFSVPQCFDEDYIWTFETKGYPWVLNLKRLNKNAEPVLNVRYGYNRLSYNRQPDYTNHVTKLYAYGSGEGVNQLNINKFTNGLGYILADKEHIEKYGIRESIWVDRRYENEETLYAAAQSMLSELCDPITSYSCGFIGDVKVGEVVNIIDYEQTYVVKKIITYGDIDDIQYELSNKQPTLALTIADLANRQRIETTYSQGATNIYSVCFVDNADANNGLDCDFYMPQSMRFVNKVVAKIKYDSFRAYSGTTEQGGSISSTSAAGGSISSTSAAGGSISSTSSAGGSISATSAAGGQISLTSESGGGGTSEAGGGQSKTSASGGGATESTNQFNLASDTGTNGISSLTGYSGLTSKTSGHSHKVPDHMHRIRVTNFAHKHSVTIPSHRHSFEIDDHVHWLPAHTHAFSLPAHTHAFSLPAHTHSFSLPAHTHSFSLPAHSHTFELPSHKHDIEPGIHRYGNPTQVELKVNGNSKGFFEDRSFEVDITEWLANDDGMISRGSFQTLSVVPNDIAHISVSLTVIGFIQSLEGGNY